MLMIPKSATTDCLTSYIDYAVINIPEISLSIPRNGLYRNYGDALFFEEENNADHVSNEDDKLLITNPLDGYTLNDRFVYAKNKSPKKTKYKFFNDIRRQSLAEKLTNHFEDNMTFLVLASRLGKVYVYRFNKAKSLWAFGPTNPVRKCIIYMITNQLFEFFVILTILINCVFLALDNAPEEAEYVFTVIYTTEMVLKIIAKGFVLHSFAYLRDPWNWLDFIVVLLGYVTLAPGVVFNFSGIRTFRVLRALRTISAIEGLKTMVNALLKSMRMLSDVLILTAFFICVFALVGLQLFSGHFHNRCVTDHLNRTANESWHIQIRNSSNWYKPVQICGNASGSMKCPGNYTCLPDVGPNPNYGFTSYDDFGWALLTSFQLVTLDFWEDVYLHIGAALGPLYVFYFMIVIFFGSFYLINLVLAVVAVSYQQETAHNADLETQYEFLREVASSYSLHKRILPKLLYDDPTIDDISNLSCVKKGPSVIILSSNTNKNSKNRNKTVALGKVFHTNSNAGDQSVNKGEESTPNSIARQKLTKIINRVKLDRVKDKLRTSSSRLSSEDSTPTRKLNIASVRSVGKRLHVPVQNEEAKQAPPETPQQKLSLASRVSNRLNSDLQTHYPLPYGDVEDRYLRKGQKLRRKVYRLVMNPMFELAVTMFILLNTICLALEYDRMDKRLKQALDISNHTFTGIFVVEMVLKLIAFTPFGYVKSKWNIFDGLVVLLSIVDLIIEVAVHANNGDFTIIRSLRLFRVLKLAQSWSTMRLLLSAIGRSLNALGNLTLILGIIVYMFAVVGTHVFGNSYKAQNFPDGKVPDWNFNNFGHSIMVIFRVLCGEWIEPLFDCMQTTGTWATAFFLPALIVGNFLVLNLFLALLLNSFADQAMEEELKKKSSMKSKLKWVSSTRKLAKLQQAFKGQKVDPENPQGNVKSINGPENLEDIYEESKITILTDIESPTATTYVAEAKSDQPKNLKPIQEKQRLSQSSNISPITFLSTNDGRMNQDFSSAALHKLNPLCPSFSCCIFSEEQKREKKEKSSFVNFRAKIGTLIKSKWFDNGVLLLIIASSVVLVFEDVHLSSRPKLKRALDILNIIFCIIFLLEFLLKLIGLGLCGYVKNPWNCLDFLIVLVSIISVTNSFTNSEGSLQSLRSLRTLRALRPLRAVSRWDGMRIVVNSLLKAIPSIGNVLLVCLVFWLIFSILGVQFFGGKFYKCVDKHDIKFDAKIIPNKSECLRNGFTWKNSNVNFDNALNGFLPLLQVATFEGWIEVMKDAVDTTQIDQQPVHENNFIAYFYFVVFIIVGSFFILNLFISVIIDNFYRLKKQYDDCGAIEVFLTPEQKQWFSTVKKALTKKPKRIIHRPRNFYQAKLFDVIVSAKFETFTMVLILINIVLMMFQHYYQPSIYTNMLYIGNLIFTAIFTLEVILRIIALRHQYFLDKWNIFDFVIVILSLVGIILEYLDVLLGVTPSVLRVARVLRIGRLLRYFNSAKGIRRLLVALAISLPALLNIGALLFLILFIYSIIGMSNFGYVKKQGALNDIVNFETFASSMLVLFRLSTSAGWNEILDSLMIQEPDCDPNYENIPNGNCGTPWIAVVFLVSFILITYLIIVNMYIAVILENFNQAHEQEEIGVTDEDIEMFYAVWQLYDPQATQYIEFEKLPFLVANLGAPLGIPFPNKVAVHNLNLPMKEDDRIHCVDVLQALLKRVVGNVENVDTEHYDNMKKTIDKKLQAAFPIRQKQEMTTTTMDRLKEMKAASVIQRSFRKWKTNKNQPRVAEDAVFMMKSSIDSVFSSFINIKGSRTPSLKRTRKKPIQTILADRMAHGGTVSGVFPVFGPNVMNNKFLSDNTFRSKSANYKGKLSTASKSTLSPDLPKIDKLSHYLKKKTNFKNPADAANPDDDVKQPINEDTNSTANGNKSNQSPVENVMKMKRSTGSRNSWKKRNSSISQRDSYSNNVELEIPENNNNNTLSPETATPNILKVNKNHEELLDTSDGDTSEKQGNSEAQQRTFPEKSKNKSKYKSHSLEDMAKTTTVGNLHTHQLCRSSSVNTQMPLVKL